MFSLLVSLVVPLFEQMRVVHAYFLSDPALCRTTTTHTVIHYNSFVFSIIVQEFPLYHHKHSFAPYSLALTHKIENLNDFTQQDINSFIFLAGLQHLGQPYKEERD